MHGLGDTPSGWSSLEYSLQKIKPRLSPDEIKYVFPPAPTDQAITINGGARMPGWFDLYDWPIGVGSKDDPSGLQRSVAQIQTEIKRLNTEFNIPSNKIVIGGFSQGGAVALLACYHQFRDGDEYEKLAGCVGLSAWLTLPDDVVKSVANKNDDPRKSIPLFWGHGTYDDKVLFEQQKFGLEKLTNEYGLSHQIVSSTQYPMGHQSCQQETVDLAEFLDRVFFTEDDGSTTGNDGGSKTDL